MGKPPALLLPHQWVDIDRFPRLRLADAPLEWRAVPGFRGPARLWVRVD